MIDAAPPHSIPSWQFLEALPGLTRIADELQLVLQPAMTQGRDEDRGFARSAWMLAKALRFLLEAAQSDDPSAFGDALAAAGHLRSLRAAAATVEELAAAGEISRSTGLDLGERAATGAAIRILWPDAGQGLAPDEVQLDLDALGRACWNSAATASCPSTAGPSSTWPPRSTVSPPRTRGLPPAPPHPEPRQEIQRMNCGNASDGGWW